MPKANFHCKSCGRVILWAYVIGYGYRFVHKTKPTATCTTRVHPQPKEGEE